MAIKQSIWTSDGKKLEIGEKKIKRKLISITLALVLCLGLTVPALASSTGTANSPAGVEAGSGHAGLIDANGSLWMWGNNNNGQLGNGSTEDSIVPIKVMDNVVLVSCGGKHTAAIKTDGSLWMWGGNYDGQLGNGSTENSTVPIKVLDNVVSVSCGGSSASSSYTAAIKTDGSLWMWGDNSWGQLGKGAHGDSMVPIKIMDDVAVVSCGSWGHTAAVKTDGSLWMWGDNRCGELGNGYVGNEEVDSGYRNGNEPLTYPIQDIPVKVMDNVASVSCGNKHTAAIKNDGSLWTWGGNEEGQLGNDRKYNADNWPVASKYQTIPVKVLDCVASVSCGSGYTAAVKTDSSLWMWGDNMFGQLGSANGNKVINIGHGDFSTQTVPIELMNKVLSVSCGDFQTFVVKTDGSVWGCGVNDSGQLGNGGKYDSMAINNRAIQTIPVKLFDLMARVKLPTSFYDVVADAYYTKAVIWAIEKGITNGTSATTFSPDKVCTTGEIITFLWKAQNSPEPTINNPFSDVTKSSYYYKAALWAYEKDLVFDSMFGANIPCTRSMTVTYLWKLAGKPTAMASGFTDVPSSAEYSKAVAWAVSRGITSGTGNNTFSPNATCTRGQIVTFLYRNFANN